MQQPMDLDFDDAPPELVEVDDIPDAEMTDSQSEEPLIPITLLTGYLGSGKTTLLQYIMSANHGYRIAVCMNDFGDTTDIESTAMSFTPTPAPVSSNPSSTSLTPAPAPAPTQPETAFLSLPNGCLCCSIKEPGITAIENMVAQRSGMGERRIDRVVVELTGVADPGEIARSFWTNEEMGGKLRLDGVVCVVDSKNILVQLEEGDDCQRQIAASDVVLLNKIDLVTKEQLEDIEERIRQINPTALFRHTHHSALDISHIFQIGGYSVAATLEAGEALARVDAGVAAPEESGSGSGTSGMGRGLTERIEGMSVGGSHAHEDEGRGDGEGERRHLDGISSIVLPVPVLRESQLPLLEKCFEEIFWQGRIPGSTRDEQERSEAEGPGSTSTATSAEAEMEAGDTIGWKPSKPPQIDILRGKGIFPILPDSPSSTTTSSHSAATELSLYVLQAVRDIYEFKKLVGEKKGGGVGEAKEGKLVLIGRGLGAADVGRWRDGIIRVLEGKS